MVRVAAAIAVMALAIACASQKSASMAPAQTPTSATAPDPHGQIEQLSGEIDAERSKLGLGAVAGQPEPMSVAPPSTADPSCHPAPSDACRDTCSVADSICGNAQKICDLAGQLVGDTWADGKCRDAKATCEDAHGQCCGCQR